MGRLAGAARAASVAAVAVVAAALAGCGGDGGGGSGGPATVAAWRQHYGVTITAVDTALDRTQAATKDGEPVGIRTSCEGLRDSVSEALDTPAVPDATVDQSLRAALGGVGGGAATCLRAMAQGDARMLERAIVEIREARLALDTAKAKLSP